MPDFVGATSQGIIFRSVPDGPAQQLHAVQMSSADE